MLFIGVSTSGSSIMELFPRWAAILGIRGGIEGRDIALRAEGEAYRATVAEIAEDPGIAGSLVTSHKVALYRHAGPLFAELDELARLCREVSCISKRAGRLVGHAKDPITAGRAMEDMLGPGYWTGRDAHVLCLGAGGAGTAIAVHLASMEDPPPGVAVVDRDPVRIASLRAILAEAGAERFELAEAGGPSDVESLMAGVPPGSLVVNATGMGKDVPGSPVSDGVAFPERGVVWDLNYRGDLTFLHQARRQADHRGLRLHDGWRYFLHGWTEVIAEVYHLDLTGTLFDRLAAAAEPLRPVTPASA